MKKIRVTVDVVLEVPDEWRLTEPNEDVGVHLQTGTTLLQPELMWLEYMGGNADEGYNWDYIDDELEEALEEMMIDGHLKMAEE